MPAPPPAPLNVTRAAGSRIARLQQALVLGGVAMALTLLGAIWLYSTQWAVVAAAGLLSAYSLVLAAEFVALSWFHREDPTPKACWRELVCAWWGEVWQAPRVFGWRQPFVPNRLPDTATGKLVTAPHAAHAVVLIHGFMCNRGFWHPWMQAMRARGVPYATMNLEPIFGSLDESLWLVDAAVQRAHAATGSPPLLVAHSMGGLVARAWLAKDPANRGRIHHVVTIGTPHHGAWLARFSRLVNGRQMRPGSAWLRTLGEREKAVLLGEAGPLEPYGKFTCWFSNADNVVFPPSTATLSGADNRLVRGVAHVALAFHPRVMRESLAMVASQESSPRERTVS